MESHRIEHHIYIHSLASSDAKLDRILQMLEKIFKLEVHMAGELDKLEQDVSETGTVVDSAIVLLNGLSQQLRDAGTDPVRLQALATALETKKQQLADAIAANTPAQPA